MILQDNAVLGVIMYVVTGLCPGKHPRACSRLAFSEAQAQAMYVSLKGRESQKSISAFECPVYQHHAPGQGLGAQLLLLRLIPQCELMERRVLAGKIFQEAR